MKSDSVRGPADNRPVLPAGRNQVNRTQRVRRVRLASAALSLGALLVAGSLMTALPVLAAGTATIRIDPATEPAAGPGSTFTVSVISNASVATSGIQSKIGRAHV